MFCVDNTRSTNCLTFFSCDYLAIFFIELAFWIVFILALNPDYNKKINKDIPHTKQGIIVTVVKYR